MSKCINCQAITENGACSNCGWSLHLPQEQPDSQDRADELANLINSELPMDSQAGDSPAEALRLIKALLKGTIFATYDVIDLDADPSGDTVIPGVSLDEAFEQQWKFIEPKLTAYAATVEREGRIDELNEFVLACELDDLEKPVGAYIQKRKAALQGPQDTTQL